MKAYSTRLLSSTQIGRLAQLARIHGYRRGRGSSHISLIRQFLKRLSFCAFVASKRVQVQYCSIKNSFGRDCLFLYLLDIEEGSSPVLNTQQTVLEELSFFILSLHRRGFKSSIVLLIRQFRKRLSFFILSLHRRGFKSILPTHKTVSEGLSFCILDIEEGSNQY